MPDSSGVLKDFVVIPTFKCLVAEEVNVGVVNTSGQVLLILDVLQTVSLVPASREHVERDLTADRVAKLN